MDVFITWANRGSGKAASPRSQCPEPPLPFPFPFASSISLRTFCSFMVLTRSICAKQKHTQQGKGQSLMCKSGGLGWALRHACCADAQEGGRDPSPSQATSSQSPITHLLEPMQALEVVFPQYCALVSLLRLSLRMNGLMAGWLIN
jgi:hypothetical protein